MMQLSSELGAAHTITLGSKRPKARRKRAYSFARAGSLWVPKRQCATAYAAMTRSLPHLHSSDSPLDWPGASNLVSWHHWRFDRAYNANLYGTGTAPPTVSHTGTVPVDLGLRVEITATAGSRASTTFRWSANNGSTWTSGVAAAASVDLGNGVSLQFAGAGGDVYNTDQVYVLTINQWRDQTGHGHHWITVDSSVARYPIPLVTAQGTAVSFDGVDDILFTTTSLATDLIGGTDTPFCSFGICQLGSTSPSSGTGVILFLGNDATNARVNWTFSNTPQHRVIKEDDAAASQTVLGGTPDTSLHVWELVHTGTVATVLIDGVSVATGSSNVGLLTVNAASIGGSYLGGAVGNNTAISWYELLTYNSVLDATTRADIRARLKSPYGI